MSGTEIVLECEYPDCNATFATGRSLWKDAEIEGREAGWNLAEGLTRCPDHRNEGRWEPPAGTPAKLVAGVNWWLNSDPGQGDDVIALTSSGEDALILAQDAKSNALFAVWVDFEGTVRTLKGIWNYVHDEADDEEEARFASGERVIWTDPDGGQRKAGKIESVRNSEELYVAFDDGGYADVYVDELEKGEA